MSFPFFTGKNYCDLTLIFNNRVNVNYFINIVIGIVNFLACYTPIIGFTQSANKPLLHSIVIIFAGSFVKAVTCV